jgi:branched-chain amino acid transport system substrate-binding protein
MRTPRTWKRTLAGVLAAGLIVAACGDDDDSDSTEAPAESAAEEAEETADSMAEEAEETADSMAEEAEETADSMAEEAGGGEELATEGEVPIAEGTTLNLDECPDDWSATTGVDGDEIRIGISLPQSGSFAAFGPIAVGMQAYFDWINETDPVGDQELVLIARDDAYEAGRTRANVEEMLDTEDIFAFTYIIGTPNNAAVRPVLDEACVPQLYNSTGFPDWGDPANWPWTIGGIFNYATETAIWCQAIVDEFGEGATVAALYANSDFGQSYQRALADCEGVDVVEEQLHDPAAPDVTNEMTTLVASGADVLVAGTSGAYCPQAVASVAGSDWRPRFYMSYTCNNLASFIEPVKDAAVALADDDAAIHMANNNKVCGDPRYEDDPIIQQTRMILDEYADGVTCEDGSYSTGTIFGEQVVDTLRSAAAMPGGLNRVNLMAAVWNLDGSSEWILGDGTYKTDGVNDAYTVEVAQIEQVVTDADGNLTFEAVGDVVSLEGETGSFEGG